MLEQAKLPQSGVAQLIGEFLVAKKGDQIVGAGAIEMHGSTGLLRSVVVDPDVRGQGVGQRIVNQLLASANEDVYLLTETAESFFVRLGFEPISREEAPADIRASEEFRCLCPESAAFMRRSVKIQPKPSR